jgi:DNA polymerase III delta prime subunit
MREEFLWVEKYRPHKVEDTILPEHLKSIFQKFVDDKNVPNLLLAGGPGVGKTTIAKAMLDELECDYIVINGSLNGNIDTLRNEILMFASSISFKDTRKYVIIDEADYLNPNSTQPALRNFIEEFSKNCGFIFTCNYKNKIIDPLHSRCSVVDFKIPKDEKVMMGKGFHRRAMEILDKESVEYEPKAVAAVIQKHFPDFRRIVNELQRYAATGKIDTGILVDFADEKFDQLVDYMKSKNYSNVRKWVHENIDMDSAVLYRRIYDKLSALVTPNSIPAIVVHLAEYQHKAAFVADMEINNAACLAEIMVTAQWQ